LRFHLPFHIWLWIDGFVPKKGERLLTNFFTKADTQDCSSRHRRFYYTSSPLWEWRNKPSGANPAGFHKRVHVAATLLVCLGNLI
jgi:hypothetical protein